MGNKKLGQLVSELPRVHDDAVKQPDPVDPSFNVWASRIIRANAIIDPQQVATPQPPRIAQPRGMRGWAYVPEDEVVNPVERPVPEGTQMTRSGRPVRRPHRLDDDEASAFLTYEGPKGRDAYLASEFAMAIALGTLRTTSQRQLDRHWLARIAMIG